MSSSAPHDTTAANRLDPNVSADGHLSTGPGVGAQDTSHVHEEGLEHIKGQLDQRGAPLGGTHTTTSAATPAQPPASNPGVEDATGEQPQTIVGTIKNYLGFTGTEARRAEDVTPAHQSSGATATDSLTSSTTPAHHSSATTTDNTTSSSGSYVGAASSAAASAGAAAASALGYDEANKNREHTGTTGTTTTLPDRTKESSTETPGSRSNVADSSFDDTKKSASATGGVANPGVDSSVPGTGHPSASEGAAAESAGEKAESSENAKDIKSGADPSKMEHRDAIPTAGGQKLGEKHWGESKIVPDNPKPAESDAGVSSAAGQPTSEVKDNTSKNTGGATSGPHHGHGSTTDDKETSGGKEKLTDKIKDKLHIGKK